MSGQESSLAPKTSSAQCELLLPVSYEEIISLVEQDMSCGVAAASGFKLHEACKPDVELLEFLHGVLSNNGSRKTGKDWRCVMKKRIGISYKRCERSLVWLDDKVLQVQQTAAVLGGRELHLPILAHAEPGNADAGEILRSVTLAQIARDEPIVVKPRNGSNSKHVFLFPKPRDTGEAAVLESLSLAMDAWDESWKKESWNQNAVPNGTVLQPMYAPMLAFLECKEQTDATPNLSRPLELKVQVLFGEVIGGCLNTHPQALWITRAGRVHIWDQMIPGFLKRHSGIGHPLPDAVLHVLLKSLAEDWRKIRQDSEQLAQSVGLDELRVDWLLGDRRWGPRIGELTYMGTFALDVLPISLRLARAFAAAHLRHLGHTEQEQCF